MYSQTILSAVGGAALGVSYVVGSVLFEQPYLTVHDISYSEGVVYADRTVNHSAIADWRVTVVQADRDGPSCNTVPGPEMHQGWSPYSASPRDKKPFTLDVWVGDPGCLSRLEPGQEHHMFMNWTPRDGTDPVAQKAVFYP